MVWRFSENCSNSVFTGSYGWFKEFEGEDVEQHGNSPLILIFPTVFLSLEETGMRGFEKNGSNGKALCKSCKFSGGGGFGMRL
ncbi:MAG: hypothetical protein BRD49_05140 [Bacteroidetes bacterium SW_10_40_5]|nr:MAG: hypothetical protein BRD49_05140 [Bacteroidetes bacterium SW_10_40_5]